MSEEKPKSGERPGDPCTIVIFGATGDLTRRKLLPALYNLRRYGLLPKDFAIVGVGRKDMTREAFVAEMGADIREFATAEVDEAIWHDFESRLYYVGFEFDNPQGYGWLGDLLKDVEARHKTLGNVLFYLATPPATFATLVKQAAAAGLADETGRWRRFIVEKPFGRDLDSAKTLNRDLLSSLSESQIYRIDHYLGKETVQNILAFRFANGIFEPVWNRRYIDHVQITVAETLGVEGRGGYYETAGVLRDMIQNHMFQLLALVAMEPPSSFDASPVRDEKVKVLNAIRPMPPEEILQRTVRGQYGEGFVDSQKLLAYRAEPSVAPTSMTETYGALKLDVENWRWAGVPFYLRSGKRLAKQDTEIVIQFRKPPLLAFGKIQIQDLEPNRLILQIQPEEGIVIEIKAKRPGATMNLTRVNLDFNYSDFGPSDKATGYERLLYDAMIGDTTLYHRADMVEAAWRIATPILDVWGSIPPRDFPNYAAGSWGPAAADELMKRDARSWRNP
ncbi:MAG TPA: glucose-6-phosphate dehydrogenase [Candidatus Polarisedimenticolaceae bacterium]|nr:glucose-6-phosphate dehydrogenase [Candidatus Polarisedimenticolaceae bacterium]